jgi:hypothetical protein
MIVLVYFWKINLRSLPIAILHMAFDRFFLKRNKKITFFKSLGTGRGETFTPSDADFTRWGLIVVLPNSEIELFDSSPLISLWRRLAVSEYRGILQPISTHGAWAKRSPFNENLISGWDGPVAAITRARIKWWMNPKFWSAVPPVTTSLKSATGLNSAIGIGEAPIGLQGTFSRWDSMSALRAFAYGQGPHSKAITMTEELDWYVEELFARFAIISEHGEIKR